MKKINFLFLLLIFLFSACDTVKVAVDYDRTADFTTYKTYDFDKFKIDRVKLSDFDKKRILNAIDEQLQLKGLTKSNNPDLLVSFFAMAREELSINQFNSGFGPGGINMPGGNSQTSVSTSTAGTLRIDLSDARKRETVWQGEGQGYLEKNISEKDEKIKEFVSKILTQYPAASK